MRFYQVDEEQIRVLEPARSWICRFTEEKEVFFLCTKLFLLQALHSSLCNFAQCLLNHEQNPCKINCLAYMYTYVCVCVRVNGSGLWCVVVNFCKC